MHNIFNIVVYVLTVTSPVGSSREKSTIQYESKLRALRNPSSYQYFFELNLFICI